MEKDVAKQLQTELFMDKTRGAVCFAQKHEEINTTKIFYKEKKNILHWLSYTVHNYFDT